MYATEETSPTKYDPALSVVPKPHLGPIPAFGKPMRSIFSLDPSYLVLNHGSYGSIPKYVREYFEYYSRCSERNPDRWMQHTLRPVYYATLKRISSYLGCKDYMQLAFSPNATTALNVVLNSMQYSSGDVLLRYNTTYGACYNTVSHICNKSGATAVDIPILLPCSNADIISSTKKVIEQIQATPGKTIRFAIVDTISSVPGIVMPYKELVKIFKDAGARVFVDAAHSLGQIQVDIDNMGCDYLTTNTHKWFFTKRGCAILYVKKECQDEVLPNTISWNYSRNEGWNESFLWQGTIDYSSYFSANAAIDFIEAAGGLAKIQEYAHGLAIDAMHLLKSKYGLQPMTETESQIGFLFNVKLPLESGHPRDDSVGETISATILTKKNASGYAYQHNNTWWMRLSSNIFLDLDDFDRFGAMLIKTIAEEKASSKL